MQVTTVLHHTGEKPKTYPRGRRCSRCRSHLSIYNASTRCWACHPTGRRLTRFEAEDAMRELAELMEEEPSYG